VLDHEGRTAVLREVLRALLRELAPAAAAHGTTTELERLARLIERGPSYVRQRLAFQETPRLEAVVDAMVNEFAEDRPYEPAAARGG
jgi:gamma-glutamyl:cysteine ligase YbdK (ATP-grasp superfamily)